MIYGFPMLTSRGKIASAANSINVGVESLWGEHFLSTTLTLNDFQDVFLITDFILFVLYC